MTTTDTIEVTPGRTITPAPKPRLWIYLLAIWAGSILTIPTLTGIITWPLREDGFLVAGLALTLGATIFLGWIPALIAYFIHKGIAGWITTGRMISAYRAEANTPAIDPRQDDLARQWAQINTYGCCMDHRDPDGYPCHGGPGCLHPDFN